MNINQFRFLSDSNNLFYIDEDTNHRGLWVHFTAPL